MEHIIKKEYEIIFGQYKIPSYRKYVIGETFEPRFRKKELLDEKNEVERNFKFVGAQPLQYTGEDTVQVMKKSVVFSPKIDGERRLLVITDKGHSGFISRNGDVNILEQELNIRTNTVLDVEIVKNVNDELIIFVFDILYYKYDIRDLRYVERRKLLEDKIIKKLPNNFYLNASFVLSALNSYDILVNDLFSEYLPKWLKYDGIIFYDVRYTYSKTEAHYGTWKWKPPNEQTIDLRLNNGILYYRTKEGFKNIIKEFQLPNKKVLVKSKQKSNQIIFVLPELDKTIQQTDDESIEFYMEKINSNKLRLIQKQFRNKRANAGKTIQSSIYSFIEDILLIDLLKFIQFNDKIISNKFPSNLSTRIYMSCTGFYHEFELKTLNKFTINERDNILQQKMFIENELETYKTRFKDSFKLKRERDNEAITHLKIINNTLKDINKKLSKGFFKISLDLKFKDMNKVYYTYLNLLPITDYYDEIHYKDNDGNYRITKDISNNYMYETKGKKFKRLDILPFDCSVFIEEFYEKVYKKKKDKPRVAGNIPLERSHQKNEFPGLKKGDVYIEEDETYKRKDTTYFLGKKDVIIDADIINVYIIKIKHNIILKLCKNLTTNELSIKLEVPFIKKDNYYTSKVDLSVLLRYLV